MEKKFFKRSFTLIELLIVIGVIIILLGLTIISLKLFYKTSDLDNTTQEIISALRLAQSKALASEGASQHGVYFDDTTSPHQYTLFKGGSYAGRETSADEIHKFPESVEIYNINLNGGKEVVFNRVDGRALPAGDLGIRLIANPFKTKNIYIQGSGLISSVNPAIPAGGRTTDSRHVHFDLGWSIQDATLLKFYFPNIPQTEIVDMADYFNPTKTEFDWQRTFVVGGVDQVFKVHTHFLDPLTTPYTRLCIHRDRNNGKTDQEVIIYIIDGGIDKEIAHYLADAPDTVNEGIFGGIKEIQ